MCTRTKLSLCLITVPLLLEDWVSGLPVPTTQACLWLTNCTLGAEGLAGAIQGLPWVKEGQWMPPDPSDSFSQSLCAVVHFSCW